MSRKGYEKVRTGCATCKVRKIKCDEARPHCRRCTSTGRSCDGYSAPPPGSFSWNQLLRPRLALTQGPSGAPDVSDPLERRSVAFFHQVVAPSLSGAVDASFWTRLVVQVAHREPAARHAVVAISTLYEHMEPDADSGSALGSSALSSAPGPNIGLAVALRHYNSAINRVLTLDARDMDVVLLVSVLFVCIELLRGNGDTAISHLKHGISMLLQSDHSRRRQQSFSPLAATYLHLSIFPSFFCSNVAPVVPLLCGDRAAVTPYEHSFMDLFEAQMALDWLSTRIVRLVRRADQYRLGVASTPVPESYLDEQQHLLSELNRFGASADALWQHPIGDVTAHHLLKMRWFVCKIWASTCLCPDETVYDYMTEFESIVRLARHVRDAQGALPAKRTKFLFQMGFGPLLHFVVIKCRHLRLRVEASLLQRQLSCQRETLWDAATMYAIGTRVIEVEHGLTGPVSEEPGLPGEGGGGEELPLPAEEVRIRDYMLGDEMRVLCDEDGKETAQRMIQFFFPKPEGGVNIAYDWVNLI